ncbi:hypothetical protein GS682_08625 [Nostoc sp. B(2019)]|nr:hypothetical protein [Nostoc sp. B(2019)]
MKTKSNNWKLLQLFTVVVVAAIVSSALHHADRFEDATISELTIEKRLAKVREYIKQRGEAPNYSSHTVSSPQDNPDAQEKDTLFKQQGKLSQWVKWAKV